MPSPAGNSVVLIGFEGETVMTRDNAPASRWCILPIETRAGISSRVFELTAVSCETYRYCEITPELQRQQTLAGRIRYRLSLPKSRPLPLP